MDDPKNLTPPASSSQESTSRLRPPLGENEIHMMGDSASSLGREGEERTNSAIANRLVEVDTIRTIQTPGRMPTIRLRGKTDSLPQDWWFASTAIPLIAATLGPLANVLSIAALVSKWRVRLPNNGQLPEGSDQYGVDIADPHWEITLNAISLGFGFFGNFCLLLNFTKRVRYIVALPATIIAWYFATGILIGIIAAMNTYVPPIRPGETYSQGFWHAIIAATLYLIGSMMLMVNMLGYFLGHYPQHFDLDDDQRTLILQTMMFFFWLAGGAAVFSKVCGWRYADALYFCDVTVLTVGFGDYVGTNDVGRGLVFPYSVIGIIFLGLMINSIRKFAIGMSKDKVIRKHQLQKREETFSRTVTSENELRDRLGLPPRRDSMEMRRATAMSRKITDGQVNANSLLKGRDSLDQYGHFDVKGRTIKFHENKGHAGGGGRGGAGRKSSHSFKKALSRDAKVQARSLGSTAKARQSARNAKLVLLKEEKDRFEAMREIQSNTHKFEKYFALSMSVFAFGILWCVGALIFMYAERRIQDLSYFEALYFCYVSLLTIGYGDFAPKSNAGKPFFVIWSLIAVPTMTILISDMSDTVVGSINRGTFKLADWTVMPKEGVWHDFLENHPKLKDWMERKTKEREAKARVNAGFELQRPDEGTLTSPLETLENLAVETTPCRTDHELARHLSKAIKRVANDLHATVPVKYSYEEWVEFTRLIRFSAKGVEEGESSDEEDRGVLGLVRWDWIGEDSPMLAEVGEAEWVLERLCESLDRYTRVQGRKAKKIQRKISRLEHQEHTLHHLDTTSMHHPYPAHPGHRKGYSYEHSHDHEDEAENVSPVLRRTSVGEEVVPLHSHAHKTKVKDKTKHHGEGDKEDGVEDTKERIRGEREYEEEELKNEDREVKDELEDELRGGKSGERMAVVKK